MPPFDRYVPRGVSPRPRLLINAMATALILSTLAVPVASGGHHVPRAGLVVQPLPGGLLEVTASRASVRELLSRIAVHSGKPVAVHFSGDRTIDLRLQNVTPDRAIERIATAARLRVRRAAGGTFLTDPTEPVLNLDVKNADVRAILAAVKAQCDIPNMMIDEEISGEGTFLFRDVPCIEGLQVILSSLGLSAEEYPNVLHVRDL